MRESWYLRFIGVSAASIYFIRCAFAPADWHFIDGANLIFHEAGHAIFMFFGQFIHIAMGSGFQILLPLSIALYFFYTDQRLSGAICLMWVGQNLINVSVYAGDAIVMRLPLLGGDGVIHDWNWILTDLHLLRYTYVIAHTLYGLGVSVLMLGIALAFWYLFAERYPGPVLRQQIFKIN